MTDTFAPFGGLSRLEDLFGELFEMFRTGHEWVLDRDAETVLRGLRARGMRTGLITNYDSRVRDVLASLGIDGLIDSVTASTLAGFAKPERAIFRTACESLGCRPEEAVHIGDDPEEDLLGAQAAGLSALLYDPNARFERLTTLRIGTLADLFRILV